MNLSHKVLSAEPLFSLAPTLLRLHTAPINFCHLPNLRVQYGPVPSKVSLSNLLDFTGSTSVLLVRSLGRPKLAPGVLRMASAPTISFVIDFETQLPSRVCFINIVHRHQESLIDLNFSLLAYNRLCSAYLPGSELPKTLLDCSRHTPTPRSLTKHPGLYPSTE